MEEYINIKEFSKRTGLKYELIRAYIKSFPEVKALTKKGKCKLDNGHWHFAIMMNFADKDKILQLFQSIKEVRRGLKRPEPFSRMYWTESSLDCYEAKMNCNEKCRNYFICKKFNSEIPPMKATTLKLIEMFGNPDNLIKYRFERERIY